MIADKRLSCAILTDMSQNDELDEPPVRLARPKQPRRVRQLDIVGTAEAAEILNVERPRIGRWIKRGVMPPTASHLQATPIWWRRDIENMRDWVDQNRRHRDTVAS